MREHISIWFVAIRSEIFTYLSHQTIQSDRRKTNDALSIRCRQLRSSGLLHWILFTYFTIHFLRLTNPVKHIFYPYIFIHYTQYLLQTVENRVIAPLEKSISHFTICHLNCFHFISFSVHFDSTKLHRWITLNSCNNLASPEVDSSHLVRPFVDALFAPSQSLVLVILLNPRRK